MKIVAGTNNKNKVREFREILKEHEILSLSDVGVETDVIEDGKTFEENALKKAREIVKKVKIPVIADDSGLIVDYLKGEPGVYSARYGGEGLTDSDRTKLLLKNMENAPEGERNARFVCTIVFTDGDKELVCEGKCEGTITRTPRGTDGFGYDPVFYVKKFKKTFSELNPDEKNSVSHRGMALKMLREKIKRGE